MMSECIDFESVPDEIENLEAQDEEVPADDSAKGRGTVKHRAVAMLLTGDQATRAKALDGLNDKERDEVQWVVATVLQIVESNGYTAADLKVEQRVTMLKPDSFDPLYFGTGDAECGPLDFDYKFGEERNYFAQLVGYALPKMEQRGETRRYGYIVYGRLKRVVRYVLERRTVETIAYALLSRRLSSNRRPTACQYCSWCRKIGTCEATSKTAVQLVDRREDWALKLPSPHVSQLHDPAWVGAARFIWKMYLEPWGAAVEWASSSMAANGTTPAGFRIQHQKGSTTVSDVQKAFLALKETVGETVLWNTLKLSIGPLAKAYAAEAGISEDKASAIIKRTLLDAGAAGTGEPITKLMREKNAEELIRAALVKPFVPAAEIPNQVTDRILLASGESGISLPKDQSI
jgi:hypothetical protein